MAEEEETRKLKLEYVGDEILKGFIERNFQQVQVDNSDGNFWLEGKQKYLKEVHEAFHEVKVDLEKKQLILTEASTLKYLNEKITNEHFYLVKGESGIYVFIHRGKVDCIKQIEKLVEDEICKIDCITVNTDDLLLDHAGKICRCSNSILVFTKDIENHINKFITQAEAHYGSIKEISENSQAKQNDLENRRSNFNFFLDHDGQCFIETHCPNVSVYRRDSGFSLHRKSSACPFTTVDVILLDVDNKREQLILTEDGVRNLMNEKLQAENIACYLVKNKERIFGVMPTAYDDGNHKVLHCINENICVRKLDADDDMVYDILMEFSGKMTYLEQDSESFLVFTKPVEDEMDEYVKNQCQNRDGQKDTHSLKSESESDAEAEYKSLTDPGGTLEGNRDSDNLNNVEKQDQNRDHDEVEHSFEALDMQKIFMNADVANYMFSYRQDEIRELEKFHSSSIVNENGTITICSKNHAEIGDRMTKIAQKVCLHSFFIDGDKFNTSQAETFQDVVEKLQQDGTHVKLHPCFKTKVVKSIMEKNVTVELVFGSVADIQETRRSAILCPLDSSLNEMCASAGHIMSKGGDSLKDLCVTTASKLTKIPSLCLYVLKNPKDSQLMAKVVYGLALDDWYDRPKDYEEKLQQKIQHLFQDTINKHFQTVAIPLEVGRKVPVFVMARVCCRALKAFLTERLGSILKRVSLCVVDKSCLPSLMHILQSEFSKKVPDPEKALNFADTLEKDEPLDDDISKVDDILPVQVSVKVGSLTERKVEAIVVPVSSKLDLNTGQLSRAVAKDAGWNIQKELMSKHTKGLGPMEVTYTGPGKLRVKNILFSSLPKPKDGYGTQGKCIGILMENIFKQLKDLKIKTVALPAFGTGSLNYSEKIVAIEMVRSIYLHAAKCRVQMVNLFAYEKESLIHRYFSEAVTVFKKAMKQNHKGKVETVYIDIRDVKGNQNFDCRIVESDREVSMCDVIVYHRKPSVTYGTDDYPSEGLCVRQVDHFQKSFPHTEMYLDLNYVEIGIEKKLDDLYNKCFYNAIRTMSCQFLVIDVIDIKYQEEVKTTLEKILKILHKVLKKEDRLKQLFFLVKPEAFQKCKQHAEHYQTDKETKKDSSFFQFFQSAPKLDWHIVPYKTQEPLGAYVVICSESEKKLQTALSKVKEELVHYNNNLDDSDSENTVLHGDMWRDSRLSAQRQNENFPHQIPQSNIKYGNESTDEESPTPLPKRENIQQTKTFKRQESNTTDEEPPPIPKRQREQKQTTPYYRQRSPFEMMTATVSNTITRHFSKEKMEHVLEFLSNEKKISCKRVGDVIQVKVAFDKRDILKDALDKGLNGYDNTRFYIREVSPQLFNLVELYIQTVKDISDIDWKYHKLSEEIELCKSENFYSDMKEKFELFKQYQVDTIDVAKVKHLVDDVLKTFQNEHLQDESSEFSGILVESVSDNNAINIHYLPDKQDKAYKLKNMLLIRLGVIKQTGRRHRAFNQFKSLEVPVMLNDHPDPSMTDTPTEMEKSGQMSSTMSRHHSYSLPVESQKELKNFNDGSDIREKSLLEMTYLTKNKRLSLKVYQGDILKLNVDCIVNAANEYLAHGAGVARIISRAAGYEFNEECRDYIKANGQLSVSECICTGPGDLHYRCVLHAVGPRWGDYRDKEDCKEALMKTIINIFKCADDRGMTSVAIPSISSGIFGVPWQICVEAYAKGVSRFEEEVTSTTLKEVHFVDVNDRILREIQSVFNNIFTVQASSKHKEDEIF